MRSASFLTGILMTYQNMTNIFFPEKAKLQLMSGSSHIWSVLIAIKYWNYPWTLDVYLLFAILLGQIESKLDYRLKTFQDFRVIFDQWPKLHLSLAALSNQKILKSVYWPVHILQLCNMFILNFPEIVKGKKKSKV